MLPQQMAIVRRKVFIYLCEDGRGRDIDIDIDIMDC
jgi:hypothetical protein